MEIAPLNDFHRSVKSVMTVALANTTARIIWALLVKKENYRAPVVAKA